MKKHKLLALGILILVGISGFLAGTHYGQTVNMASSYQHVMRVELYLYKNGKLVYYDPDDPTLKNFLGFLEAVTDNDNNVDDDVTRIDGTLLDLESASTGLNNFGRAVVMVSDGTGVSFSRTMYNLPGNVYKAIASSTIQNDNTLIISGTVTVSNNASITWVGLGTYMAGAEDTITPDNTYVVLLFADQLSTPISVGAGDVVTVVYKIVFP